MKFQKFARILFFLCLNFTLVVPVFSQISITAADMPSPGDTVRFSMAKMVPLNLNQTGTSQNWMFGALTPASQEIDRFLSPFAAGYPQFAGTVGYKISDSLGQDPFVFRDLHSFTRKKPNVYETVALGAKFSGFPVSGLYSDSDEVYILPLTFGKKDSTTFRVKITLFGGLGTLLQKGSRVNIVDGWGTITTPYVSNKQCIRVKTIVYEEDSIDLQGLPFPVGIKRVNVEYKWLANGEKIPLLEVKGILVGQNFVPQSIKYRDVYRNLAKSLSVFSVDKNVVTTADTVSFTDLSQNGPLSWFWSFSPASVAFLNGTTSSSRNPQVRFTGSGVYSVTLKTTNVNGSHDSTRKNLVSVSNATGMRENEIHSMLKIYPNPFSEVINLDLESQGEDMNLELVDVSGRVVLEKKLNMQSSSSIDASGLPCGLYLLRLSVGEKKIIKPIFKN